MAYKTTNCVRQNLLGALWFSHFKKQVYLEYTEVNTFCKHIFKYLLTP
jgi:hypothetical protein